MKILTFSWIFCRRYSEGSGLGLRLWVALLWSDAASLIGPHCSSAVHATLHVGRHLHSTMHCDHLHSGSNEYSRVLDYSIFKSLLVPYSENFTTRPSSRVVAIFTFLVRIIQISKKMMWVALFLVYLHKRQVAVSPSSISKVTPNSGFGVVWDHSFLSHRRHTDAWSIRFRLNYSTDIKLWIVSYFHFSRDNLLKIIPRKGKVAECIQWIIFITSVFLQNFISSKSGFFGGGSIKQRKFVTTLLDFELTTLPYPTRNWKTTTRAGLLLILLYLVMTGSVFVLIIKIERRQCCLVKS